MAIDLLLETLCSNCDIVACMGDTYHSLVLIYYLLMRFSSITLTLSIQDSILFIKFACS